MKKIVIVGAGRVGESTAQCLLREQLCQELVLLDITESLPQGVALDLQESASLWGSDIRVCGGRDYALAEHADLVVVTAGLPRKEGMSRSDLLQANHAILAEVMQGLGQYAPQAFLIVVSNPVDVMTSVVKKYFGWDPKRLIGLSGVLDSARMISFIVEKTGLSVRDVQAMVLGGHGDAMVPVASLASIAGIPLSHFLPEDAIASINQRTQDGGAEIIHLKKTSSAYDAPAAAIATMIDAVSHNRKRILPCVTWLNGEYGQKGMAMGVPVILGAGGVEGIIELPLQRGEQEAFDRSAVMVGGDLTLLETGLSDS